MFFENRRSDAIGKPKELWKALKSIVLPSETSICGANAPKVKKTTSFEIKPTLDVFKNYYSTLNDNVFQRKKVLRSTNVYKAAGIDDISGLYQNL